MGVETSTRVAKTLCNLCPNNCGLNVRVEKDRIVKVEGMLEHPFGHPCIKARAIIDWVYNKERITEPMRKVKGKWQQVSWDEALDFVADKLTSIKESVGARSLVVHLGFPFIGTPLERVAHRFCDVYGSPNFTTGGSVCFCARMIGQSITFDHNAMVLSPNYRGTQCNVVWGINPAESNLLMTVAIKNTQKQGAKLIVIDPRFTPLAKQADIHAQIRPGTDTALALGILNVIISEGIYDKEFVEKWTYGFSRLADHVKDYPPERVSEITWIPPDTIKGIARMYAASKPACITQGVALDHCTNGVQTSRALACLVAICGNYDVPGGSTFSTALEQRSLRASKGITGEVGASYPLFSRFIRQSSSAPVTHAILEGKPYPIKALIINGSNIMLTWPETKKVKQALEQLELLVVMDMFMNETAEMADVFLPAASFIEATVLKDYAPVSLAMVVLTQQVVKPLGNSWADWKFWVELGRRMGYEEYFPWNNDDELYTTLLEPTSCTVESLKEKPEGIFHHGREQQRYLVERFRTPSGKVELYSDLMKQYGYDPLPTYHEPAESPISKPDMAKEYPLILISGPRVLMYTHSQLRNVEAMRKRHPEPLAQIHLDTAKGLGIAEGDMVKVETSRGSVQMKAQLTTDILPQVVSIPHGWGSWANANLVTSNHEMDPISGFAAFKSMLCRVTKCGANTVAQKD
jgi:anaerobic selenocysteine-containing dehydrogenase